MADAGEPQQQQQAAASPRRKLLRNATFSVAAMAGELEAASRLARRQTVKQAELVQVYHTSAHEIDAVQGVIVGLWKQAGVQANPNLAFAQVGMHSWAG